MVRRTTTFLEKESKMGERKRKKEIVYKNFYSS